MKRLMCLLLIFAICMPLLACQEKQPTLKEPVNFYFPRREPTYGTDDSLLAAVKSEGAGFSTDPLGLLNLYMQGPQDSSFRNVFPAGAELLFLTIDGKQVELQVNKYFAQLSGLDLTIACACLTLTTLDLTGAETVCITAKHANLDGQTQIVMDRSCITLLDQHIPETT